MTVETEANGQSTRQRAAAEWIESRGAGKIRHVNGTLLAHLQGTAALLAAWRDREALSLAALCHTAYGTDGFRIAWLTVGQRAVLRDLIGEEAEAITYFFQSCDRRYFYPQIGRRRRLSFRDRFTNREFEPSMEEMQAFVELLFANELDLLIRGHQAYVDKMRPVLLDLLSRCEPYASANAFSAFLDACGHEAT